MTDAAQTPEKTMDGVAQFYLEGVELHRGKWYAVFRTFWEGKEAGSIGVEVGKHIKMGEYVHLTVIDVHKVGNAGLLVLNDPPRSSARVKLLMDGAPVPGYPEIMEVKVGQTLTVQSIKRVLQAGGIRKVKRI